MSIKRFVLVMITVVAIMTVGRALVGIDDARGASDAEEASCTSCHQGVGKDLPANHPAIEDPEPQTIEAIRKIFDARAGSRFLGGIHAKNEVSCLDCHGETMPEMETTVETDTCLGCHDSYENLAELTVNAECAEKNPHKSHLGEVDCAVCHKGHSPSQAYCLQCHSNFVIPMPGDGK